MCVCVAGIWGNHTNIWDMSPGFLHSLLIAHLNSIWFLLRTRQISTTKSQLCANLSGFSVHLPSPLGFFVSSQGRKCKCVSSKFWSTTGVSRGSGSCSRSCSHTKFSFKCTVRSFNNSTSVALPSPAPVKRSLCRLEDDSGWGVICISTCHTVSMRTRHCKHIIVGLYVIKH